MNNSSLLKWTLISVLPILLSACGHTLRKNSVPDYAATNVQHTRLAQQLGNSVNHQFSSVNKQAGFYLLHDGMQAFASILYLTQQAQVSLDLQYWSFHQDATGKLLAYHLLKAADRGVKVRLLLDDFMASGGNSLLHTLNKHPNIQVKLYNPANRRKWLRHVSMVTQFNRANRRMHNKALIADNSVAIVGGRNIGDAYYYAKPSYLYRDLDVMAIGGVVQRVSASFDAYWNARWAVDMRRLNRRLLLKIGYRNLRDELTQHAKATRSGKYWQALNRVNVRQLFSNPDKQFVWARYKVLYDPPGKIKGIKKTNKNFLEHKISRHMSRARRNVKIVTPYFVPQRFGLRWTKQLSKKGVDVSVLTNSMAANDFSISHGGYQRYRVKLLKNGVNLYEFKRTAMRKRRNKIGWLKTRPVARLHAKTVTIDDRFVYIGSVNLTPRSRYLNTEITIMIDSPELAARMNRTFDTLTATDNSYRLTLKKRITYDDERTVSYEVLWNDGNKNKPKDREPEVGLLQHMSISFLSLLPIEDLL